MNRWKAAGIHLGISAAIGGIMVALMLLLWYPGVYFQAMGGDFLLLLLVGCDVVIGPLITLIIFKPGKRGLKLDLAIIACVQLAALSYGSYMMFIARPVFTVFAVDRFDVVAASQISSEELAKVTNPEFASLSLTGPRIAGLKLPTDPRERDAIPFGGRDAVELPRLYLPYSTVALDAARKAKPLSALGARSGHFPEMLDSLKRQTGKDVGDLGFLPLSARNQDMSVILDRRSGQIEGIFPITPW